MTAVRRKRNSYDIIQDDVGNWVGDSVQIEAMITKYYKDLFSAEGGRDNSCISGAFPKLSSEETRIFNREVTWGIFIM